MSAGSAGEGARAIVGQVLDLEITRELERALQGGSGGITSLGEKEAERAMRIEAALDVLLDTWLDVALVVTDIVVTW